MKKRGFSVWVSLLVVALVSLFALPSAVLAWDADRSDVEHTGWHVFGPSGYVNLTGTWKIDGTEVTASAAELNGVRSSFEVNGDITLASDETIDNASNCVVRITYANSTNIAQQGTLLLESDATVAQMNDNDLVSVVYRAYDSTTSRTEYASIDLRADDVTDSTEDGGILIKTFINGTERTVATLGAANTVGASQATLALTSSDWAIDATGVATGLGNITSDGTVAAAEVKPDGKYAVTGGDATTGLMVLKAAVTKPATELNTNTFAVVFGAAPVVVCTYSENPGTNMSIYVTSVTASNFVAASVADKNFNYIAVGTRP